MVFIEKAAVPGIQIAVIVFHTACIFSERLIGADPIALLRVFSVALLNGVLRKQIIPKLPIDLMQIKRICPVGVEIFQPEDWFLDMFDAVEKIRIRDGVFLKFPVVCVSHCKKQFPGLVATVDQIGMLKILPAICALMRNVFFIEKEGSLKYNYFSAKNL